MAAQREDDVDLGADALDQTADLGEVRVGMLKVP
jgi:hypothetical protein